MFNFKYSWPDLRLKIRYSPPNEKFVRNEIYALWEEYEEFNLTEYVDLYYKKNLCCIQIHQSLE